MIEVILLCLIMTILDLSLSLSLTIVTESDAEKLLVITYYLIFLKLKFLKNQIRGGVPEKPSPK